VLWSRPGSSFTRRFAEVARACEKLPPDALIDDEVVSIDENGEKRESFPWSPKKEELFLNWLGRTLTNPAPA
jgi:hypothetical protein